jgi:uncharacterized DUF497 family protein
VCCPAQFFTTWASVSRPEFEEAMQNNPIFIDFSDTTGEPRWYVVGGTSKLRVLFLVYAFREQKVRPVTGWDASKELTDEYFRSRRG